MGHVVFGTLYIIKDLLIGMIGHLLSFCYQPHAIQILSSLFGMIWHASLFQYVIYFATLHLVYVRQTTTGHSMFYDVANKVINSHHDD